MIGWYANLTDKMSEDFNLERQLLDDLGVAFKDVSQGRFSRVELMTPLMNLGLNSLSFLEGVQLVCDKYDVEIKHEELVGTTIVGRVERILEAKILQKYSNDLEKIKQVAAERELNLVGDGLITTPGPIAINYTKKIAERKNNKKKKKKPQ